MEKVVKETKVMKGDYYNHELDNQVALPSKKVEIAKAYFKKNGLPDFNKILMEAETKKNSGQ